MLNFFDVNGEKYPFQMVEQIANEELISVRTGCFCNPGIDELNHCITPELLKNYFTSRNQGDYYDFINFTNKIRGGVRVSIGIATTRSDLDRFLSFAAKFLNRRVFKFQEHESFKVRKSPWSWLTPLKTGMQLH